MENQITTNPNALKLFFNEDVFLVKDTQEIIAAAEPVAGVQEQPETAAENKVKSYPDLAEITETAVLKEPAQPKIFKYLGGNKKSVLIIVHAVEFEVSTAEGRELLRKIVKAMELGTPDFALLNYAHFEGTSFAELQEFFKPVLMLCFGVTERALSLSVQWTGEIIHHQGTKMIFAPDLHVLDGDLNGKKMLWANLKRL